MKINIKGFTFVGFAAAIFAMNAMAANEATAVNTVTSKSYVDAKIVQTTDGTAIDKAPSENAVKTALATKHPLNSATTYKVGYNSDWAGMTSAVVEKTGDGAYIDITAGNNGEAVVGLDTSKLTTTYDSETWDTAATAGNLVTQGVIADALEANGGTVNTGVLTVTQNGVNQGTFGANDANNSSIAIAAPNWDQTTDTAADYIQNKPTITNGANDIAGATEQDNKELPTTYAVKQYLADSSVVGNGTLSVSVNGTVNTSTFTANQAGNTEIALTGIELVTNKADEIDASNSASSTAYPTTSAVYDYVQAQTGGNTIPTMDTSICNNTTPCALVAEVDGLHWRTMATADSAGGTLGDLVTNNP